MTDHAARYSKRSRMCGHFVIDASERATLDEIGGSSLGCHSDDSNLGIRILATQNRTVSFDKLGAH
jgi:hypothetical protein